MKLAKLLLAVVGVAVLLGTLVASASARNFSVSEQRTTALWTRMNLEGGFGTVECEVKLSGSLHTRTATKTVNSLIGYITEGTVLRCSRGSATINQASLPWHRRYRSFEGTLPNITGVSDTVTGVELTVREPVFGVTCTVRREAGTIIIIYTYINGVLIRIDVIATIPCGSFTGGLSGSTNNVTSGSGTRITTTLI